MALMGRHRPFARRPANGSCRHPNHRATTIWHTARVPDEHSLTSRQADQLRTDVASVESGLEVIMERVARCRDAEGAVARRLLGDAGGHGGHDGPGAILLPSLKRMRLVAA